MTTIVINIRDAPLGWQNMSKYVYVGRPYTRGKYDLPGSPFANPFVVGADGDQMDCVMKFKRRILTECPDLFDQVAEKLEGKVLVCWCKPKFCHGDILAQIADGKLQFEGTVAA